MQDFNDIVYQFGGSFNSVAKAGSKGNGIHQHQKLYGNSSLQICLMATKSFRNSVYNCIMYLPYDLFCLNVELISNERICYH